MRRPEHSFLDLYLRHVGRSQVPERFHFWSGLSLIAACLQERAWFEKWRGSRLLPNLYVILVAPSGVGKGNAIREAVKFVSEQKRARLYQGAITGAALLKYLSPAEITSNGQNKLAPKIWLSTPELSQQVGQGPVADDFIKTMTQLWDGGEIPFRKSTVTNWSGVVRNYVVNWIGGSEEGWLADALNSKAVRGGFFARCVCARAKFDPSVRVREIEYPSDYDELRTELEARVAMMLHGAGAGQYRLDADAGLIHERWFHQRPAPQDDELLPLFAREDDLVLKLCILLAVSDGADDGMIRAEHMKKAQGLVAELRRESLELMQTLLAQGDRTGIEYIYHGIVESKSLTKAQSLERAMKRGFTRKVHDEVIETLVQAKRISVDIHPKKGLTYTRKGDPRWYGFIFESEKRK